MFIMGLSLGRATMMITIRGSLTLPPSRHIPPQRQAQSKRRPPPQLTAHPNIPPHHLGIMAANGQPQPRAPILARRRAIRLHKRPKDFLHLGGR
jgi:hypothetical protein